MAAKGRLYRFRRWAKQWYPTFAVGYYVIGLLSFLGLLAIPALLVTLLVNFANRSPKDLATFSEPLGRLLSPNAYIFLLVYRWPIMTACLLLISSMVYSAYADQQRKLLSMGLIDDVARQYREFLDRLRSYTLQSMQAGKMEEPQFERYEQNMFADTDDFFVRSANRISVLFGQYTDRRCHVSIKLFDPLAAKVKTVARDSLALENRGSVDERSRVVRLWPKYRLCKNTG